MGHVITVLIDPITCSAMVAASVYAPCPRLDIFDKIFDTDAPATIIGGRHDTITSASCHPLANATTKPLKKSETS